MAVVVGIGIAVFASASRGIDPGNRPKRISFARQVQPLFDAKCASCHPSSYPDLDLRPGHSYRQLVSVPAMTAPSYERVLPHRPGLSYLLIGPEDPSRRGLLSPSERRLIAAWIRQGARNN